MPRIAIPEGAEYQADAITSGMEALLAKTHPEIDPAATPQESSNAASQAAEEAARKTVEDGASKSQETEEETEARETEEAAIEKARKEKEKEHEGESEEEKAARVEAEEAEASKVKEKEAAEAAKKAEADPDADLDNRVKELGEAHVRPKTRQLAEFLKGEAKTARAAQRALAKEKMTLEAKIAELEARPVGEAPKEMTEKIAAYEQQIRELDATRDPEIVSKYDQPITRARDGIINILKSFGVDKNEDGTPAPDVIPALIKAGLNYDTLDTYIQEMEKNGFKSDARKLQRLLDSVDELSEQRSEQLKIVQSQVTERTQARTKAQEAAHQQEVQEVIRRGSEIVGPELQAIQKDFSHLAKPEPPLTTDKPEVVKFKNAAIAEYDLAATKISEIVKGFSTVGLTGKPRVEAQARMAAWAVQAAVIRTRLLPRLQSDLKAKDARIAQLEADLGKYRKAGDITRAHGAALRTASPKDNEAAPAGQSTEDAMAAFARKAGYG